MLQASADSDISVKMQGSITKITIIVRELQTDGELQNSASKLF
jgi:hypothetical protein